MSAGVQIGVNKSFEKYQSGVDFKKQFMPYA
jgi:hypothetical protein